VAALALIAAGCAAGSRDSAARATTDDKGRPVTRERAASSPSPGCGTQRGSDDRTSTNRPERRTLTVNGVSRSYLLARPSPRAGRTAPAPVVVLFHGNGANAEAFADVTRLPAKGVESGAVVVAPDGLDHTWQLTADGTDAAFVDAMLDDVGAAACVDEGRVVASGFSAGALFAISYSCTRPGRIAGVVAVTTEAPGGCHDPLSVVAIHGTLDSTFPYTATAGHMADWAELNGCDPSPAVRTVGSEIVHHVWSGCTGGTEVALYEVTGGGHTWPGSDVTKIPQFVREQSGLMTEQIDASAITLAFAARSTRGTPHHRAIHRRTEAASEVRSARAADSRTVMAGPDTVHCLATAAQTGGSYSFLEIEIPAGSGPPPHQHAADEWFYLLSGTVVIDSGDRSVELRPGDYLHVPRGTRHSVKATMAARLLAGYAPGGEEEQLFCPR
jgi:polyhydroxybutyrate depolymerase